MSRASMRMKQYRPMSADFTKVSTLSSVFGLSQEPSKPNGNGVLLINYKRSTPDTTPTNSPRPFQRRSSVGGVPYSPGGIAPIATQEQLEEDLEEENCNDQNEEAETSTITNGNVKNSTPKRSPDSNKILRQMRSSGSDNSKGAHASDPKSENSVFWSDDDSGAIQDDSNDGADIRSPRSSGDLDSRVATSSSGSCYGEEDSDSDVVGEADFESFSGTDEESESAGNATLDTSSGNQDGLLGGKSRFTKTKSLREKIRTTLRRSAEKEITQPPSVQVAAQPQLQQQVSQTSPLPEPNQSESKLSRLFSLRRSVGPGNNPFDSNKSAMPRVAEEEEQMLGGTSTAPLTRRQQPPTLSPMPSGLTPEQLKRRHIVASLVHSENNYVSSLERLVNDYKKPLEESSPPILSHNKVQLLFHRVPEILECHSLFRIALSEAIKNWDRDEKIGDVFVASFSKAVVLEIYSEFINNFTAAMECAKQESKRKSALADFLKVKQITAHDRVSFFGLMVKPVQRFPQFILLLQDLLKETPPGHPDRMALQLALTTLESLAEMLNERKREAEQFAAFRDKMRNISGKFPPPKAHAFSGSPSYCSNGYDNSTLSSQGTIGGNGSSAASHPVGSRFLLREDDMTQLEFNAAGLVARSKQRRLLLLNDLLVCATVNGRTSEVEFGGGSGQLTGYANERLSLKWAVPVNEVELIDGAAGGTLARVLGAGGSSGFSVGTTTKRSSLTRSVTPNHLGLSSLTLSSVGGVTGTSQDSGQAENLAQDMSDLMHDFDVVSRVASLIGTLKGRYETLSTAVTANIMAEIQRSIRQKDEEMSWLDACCLHFSIKGKTKTETYTFQTRDPNVKKEWIVELRLAQLALDPNNSPGWDVLEQERSVSTKMPLYVKSHLVLQCPRRATEVTCASSYTLFVQTPTRTHRPQTYVWANATDGTNSYLRIFSAISHHTGLKEMGTITLPETGVKAIQYVPGLYGGIPSPDNEPLKGDLVWVGTDARRITIYSALDPDRGTEIAVAQVQGEILCIQYHCDAVWVGLATGKLAVFRRNPVTLAWDLSNVKLLTLGTDPVVCLLPVRNAGLYAACGKKVFVVDGSSNETLKSFIVQPRNCSNGTGSSAQGVEQQLYVHQMAQSGVGLWVALRNSPTICLYHTETFRHLQDINIASNVSRVLAARYVSQPQRNIHVTALLASRGLLWVGTNVGIALTVPLPRLEGVPIISGRANISFHAHYGCVTFFLNISSKVETPSALLPLSGSLNNNNDVSVNLNNNGPASLPVAMDDTHMIREESERDSSEEEDPIEVTQDQKNTLKKKYSDSVIPNFQTDKNSNPSPGGTISGPPQQGSTKLKYRNSSPGVTRRPRSIAPATHVSRRTSKTLPRGFSLNNGDLPNNECDVYGLYGELLNVRNYDFDSGELDKQGDDLRKSDPELSTIPYRVSTLDRRVFMKTNRPRSLDMSSWSMDSRGSSGQTTSSSEAGSERPSPNVSRNASFQSNSPATVTSSSQVMSSGPPSINSVASSTVSSSSASSQPQPQPLQSQPVKQPLKMPNRPKVDNPKTVTTLMGGRGYINWRRSQVEKQKTSALAQINNCDAFLVIWEMKL